MHTNNEAKRVVVLLIGYLMTAHFLVGVAFTTWFMIRTGAYSFFLLFMPPYIGILCIFGLSVGLGHLRRIRAAIASLVLGLALAVGTCCYDFVNARWQINGGGRGATYTMWWWYYEPFWHGYEAGNI